MIEINNGIENLNTNNAELRAIENRPGFVSRQSFNFANHYLKGRDGYGSISVFNDDKVDNGIGIPMHPHANFEILSVILSGEMVHKDTIGNTLLVKTNEIKLMSSGSGLMHGGTCYNGTNFLQIWIKPNILNTPPVVSTLYFIPENRINNWQLQVSPDVNDNVLTIKQAIKMYRGNFNADQQIEFKLPGRHKVFLMPLTGAVQLNNKIISTRDSAEFDMTNSFSFITKQQSDIWLMAESIH